jgi:hypothetical protein
MNRIIGLLLIGILLAGCATTNVNIGANVDGAKVVVDGKVVGSTPVNSIKLKNSAGKTYPIVIEKEGYKTFQGALKTEANAPAITAIIIGYTFFWLLLPALLLINLQYTDKPVADQYFVLEKDS